MIEQPWGDDRLKMNGAFIGCATKENADEIMRMQAEISYLRLVSSNANEILNALRAEGRYLREALVVASKELRTVDGPDKNKEAGVEIESLRSDNRKLRYLLARQHDSAKHMIYGDDGELQCSACWIDFRRDTVADIERKLYEAGMRELERMVAAGEWPLHSPQGV